MDLFSYSSLIHLNLSLNCIQNIIGNAFDHVAQLIVLDLSSNLLTELKRGMFIGLKQLRQLELLKNPITRIHDGAFLELNHVEILNLTSVGLKVLHSCSFCGLSSCQTLDLSRNYIAALPNGVFLNMKSLSKLFLDHNPILSLGIKNIHSLTLSYIRADREGICCIAKVIKSCNVTYFDVFTGCENLLDNVILKIVVWVVGACSLLFNTLAFIFRLFPLKQISSQNFLIINLAASDILLSLYLLILSSINVHYQGIFAAISYNWRQTIACKTMAILSSVSANMSIYILTVLAFLRAMAVLFHFKIRQAHIILVALVGWISNYIYKNYIISTRRFN